MSKKTIIPCLIGCFMICGVLVLSAVHFGQARKPHHTKVAKSYTVSQEKKKSPSKESKPATTRVPTKSMEEKQKVMEVDLPVMGAYGLYYDYANLNLVQVVQAYLDEMGIDHSQVAFSYKDLTSGQTYAMNETQPMTAGSTYKLPLNMLVVDEVEKGNLSLTERFDITHTRYEYIGEHNNYVAAFNGTMSIPEMQKYSLLYSENTPAYALAERLGGLDKVYAMYQRYGKGKGEVETINQQNQTTTDYYIQVLDYLWKHQEKYKDLLYYIGESFPNEYYKRYVRDIPIYQKPGYVAEALNIDAIVCETKPYLIALYTAGLGGTTSESNEISGVGITQVGQLAYVINEWHRVNMN
jgi:hypothetical protein